MELNQTQKYWSRLSAWVFSTNADDNSAVRIIRVFLRIIFIVWHEAGRAKLTIRASALTYSVILSMVPLLAMSTALLKGLGSGDQLRIATERFIEQLDPRPSYATEGSSAETPVTQLPSPDDGSNMTSHLYRAIDTIFDYVDKTNFAALGIIGIAGTLIVVVMVFSNIEDAMNDIWREKKGRPIFRKVMDYMALLILLPVSINMALAGEAILANEKMMGYLEKVLPVSLPINALFKLLPFAFIILSLMLMYLFFSRARVNTSAAFIGAFFAAVFWLITQKVYIVLQVGVAKYNAIYGSFATVPLFLVWVYLGWTFILFGAALAYAVQNRNHYIPHETYIPPYKRLQLAFDIVRQLYSDFSIKHKTTVSSLIKAVPDCSTAEIEWTLATLQRAEIVRRVGSKDTSYILPATDISRVTPGDILDAVFNARLQDTYGSEIAQMALQGARQALPAKLLIGDDPRQKTMNPDNQHRDIYTTLGDNNILLIVPNGLPNGTVKEEQHFLTPFALQLGKQLGCYSVINNKYKETLVDFSNMQAVKQRKKLTDSFLLHIKRFSDEIEENDLTPLVLIFQVSKTPLPEDVDMLLGYGQGLRGDRSKPHRPTIAPSLISKLRIAVEDHGLKTGVAESSSPYCGREQNHINQMFHQKNYLEGFYNPEVQSLLVTLAPHSINSDNTAFDNVSRLHSSLAQFKEKMPLVRKVNTRSIDTSRADDLQYIFRIHRDEQYNELARETYIEELANSIKKNGLLHPLVLLQKADGRYKILCGFRRFQALQRLQAGCVEAKVFAEKNFTTEDFFNISLAENTKRRNLNPVEIGNFLDSASASLNLNNTMLAEQFGETLGIGHPGQKVSHTTIHKYRKVHQMRSRGESPEIINDLINEKLQFGIAAEILAPIKSPADRDSLYTEVIKPLSPTRPQITKILNLLKQRNRTIADALQDPELKTSLGRAMESKQPATSFIRYLERGEKQTEEDLHVFKKTVQRVRKKYFGPKASTKDFDLKREQQNGDETISLSLRVNSANYQEVLEKVKSLLDSEKILSK